MAVIERVYTPSELNRLTKDIEEKARASKSGYPVFIAKTDGQTGRPVASILELTETGSPKVFNHIWGEEGSKNQFVFKAQLATYEYIDPITKETKKIQLPKMGVMDIIDLYVLTADMIQFSEAIRKFTTLQTMTNKQVSQTGLASVGVVLADKLSGEPGISTTVEQLLRESFIRNGVTGNINAYLKDHEDGRVAVELKDKYWTGLNKQYEEACRHIAKALKETNVIEMVRLESNGIVPSAVQEAPTNVSETSDMSRPSSVKDKYKAMYDLGSK